MRYRVLAFSSRYGTPHHTLRSFLRRQGAAAHCLQQLLPRARGESAEACAIQLPVSATWGNRWQRLLLYFRSREEIDGFREKQNFIVLDVRGDLQAVDLNDIERALPAGDLFFEGNPFVGRELLKAFASKITVLSIFLTPLSREEIQFLQSQERGRSLADFLTDVMRRKLLRRTQRQKNILSLKDLENIERRAASAYTELKEAWRFEYVIPNHDGEDSENWDAFYYPVGDARKTLFAFAQLVGGKVPTLIEKWDEFLVA